jgi:hypothetical protein
MLNAKLYVCSRKQERPSLSSSGSFCCYIKNTVQIVSCCHCIHLAEEAMAEKVVPMYGMLQLLSVSNWNAGYTVVLCDFFEHTRYCASCIIVITQSSRIMVTIGGDLQPGCLADRLLTGLGQPQINP